MTSHTTTASQPFDGLATPAAAPAVEEATYRRIAWRILPLLFVCYIINYIDRANIGIAQIQFKADLHFSDLVYGIGAGLFFVGFLLFEVPSNLMLARMGARKTLLRIMTLWGAVSCAMMFVRTPMEFYVARMLLGAAEAGFFPGLILYLSYWFPAERRARVTALSFVAIPIATMIGAPTSGWIMRQFHEVHGLAGWQWMFLLEGLPAIVLGVIVFFSLEDRPESAKWLSADEKARLTSVLGEERRQKAGKGRHGGTLAALGDWRVYVAGLVSFCAYVLASTIAFFAPVVIQSTGVRDTFHVGLLSAIPPVVGIVAMLIVSRHSDRHRERRWHAAVPLMCAALSLMVMPYLSHNLELAVLLLAIATAGHLSSLSVFWTIPSTYLAPASAAAGIAVVSSIGAMGGLVGPSVIGYVKSTTGSLALGLQVAGCFVLFGSILLLVGIPARLLPKGVSHS
ncbi:MFS transporter [Pandoraea pulmonicola]|uniref:Inner membrane transport protein RhmT n=1 Tax=Pandoraea pulmonicola TaxID=93221 RepID=A0AAJ4ZBL9_PANPU|nr:MFS transporter [Pandoraea pulmonicola]AJC21036.1 MFS transporter [Pandoraea pulmonicola]SUA90324.1 Inner membrane transport protein RhmT [Pandoraea pulmonicola]